jgi:hypothetical protein
MQNIAKNIKGSGYGNVHLFGPFSKLTVEGEALIKNGGLGIDYLNYLLYLYRLHTSYARNNPGKRSYAVR